MDHLSLSQALQHIEAVFDLKKLLQTHSDHQDHQFFEPANADQANGSVHYLKQIVIEYYKQSEIGYRKYHSEEGSIHMALNEGEAFDATGYYAQPQEIAEQVKYLNAKTVLEVGSGKGFNSRILAQQFPSVQFLGLDLTPLHIRLAQRFAQNCPNLSFRLGDFNQTDLASESIDLVFGVD
ncbi:MAG: class I SAM-dependent methyltransferase, partial [Prochlorotrichaceae cyanobacterium]